jgi:hypothetical protein
MAIITIIVVIIVVIITIIIVVITILWLFLLFLYLLLSSSTIRTVTGTQGWNGEIDRSLGRLVLFVAAARIALNCSVGYLLTTEGFS